MSNNLIKYDKLFALLKEKGIKKQRLRDHEKYSIHAAGVDKLTKGKTIDTVTIGKLCAMLDCQPGDILAYVPDGANHTKGDEAHGSDIADI